MEEYPNDVESLNNLIKMLTEKRNKIILEKETEEIHNKLIDYAKEFINKEITDYIKTIKCESKEFSQADYYISGDKTFTIGNSNEIKITIVGASNGHSTRIEGNEYVLCDESEYFSGDFNWDLMKIFIDDLYADTKGNINKELFCKITNHFLINIISQQCNPDTFDYD
jgi:hypothetical protein